MRLQDDTTPAVCWQLVIDRVECNVDLAEEGLESGGRVGGWECCFGLRMCLGHRLPLHSFCF